MSKRSRVKVKVRPEMTTEREQIIEFMATGDDVKDGAQGGLISILIQADGHVKVEPYRLDPGVKVVTPLAGLRKTKP